MIRTENTAAQQPAAMRTRSGSATRERVEVKAEPVDQRRRRQPSRLPMRAALVKGLSSPWPRTEVPAGRDRYPGGNNDGETVPGRAP